MDGNNSKKLAHNLASKTVAKKRRTTRSLSVHTAALQPTIAASSTASDVTEVTQVRYRSPLTVAGSVKENTPVVRYNDNYATISPGQNNPLTSPASMLSQDKGKTIKRRPFSDVCNVVQQPTFNCYNVIPYSKNQPDACSEATQTRLSSITNTKKKSYQTHSTHPSANNRSNNLDRSLPGPSVLHLSSAVGSPNLHPHLDHSRTSTVCNTPPVCPSTISTIGSLSTPCATRKKKEKLSTPIGYITPVSVLDNEFAASGSNSSNRTALVGESSNAISDTPLLNPSYKIASGHTLNYPPQSSVPLTTKRKNKSNKCKARVDARTVVPPFDIEIPSITDQGYADSIKKLFGISKDYLDHGDPTFVCMYCQAVLWKDEALTGNPNLKSAAYSMCCSKGKVQLPPTPNPPDLLKRLYENNHPKSKHFIQNIRAYNMMFSFTSMGGKIDTSVNRGRGPYCFRLSGQNCHRMGSLLPMQGMMPKFSQLYIFDTENEVKNRQNAVSSGHGESSSDESLDRGLIKEIQDLLDVVNPLVISYRMARDRYEADNQQTVRLKLIGTRETDGRTYNLPTASEVAGLIIGDIDTAFDQRDIIVQTQTGHLQRISELHPSYIALQYPLLFPLGQDGYRRGIKHRNVDGDKNSGRTEVTIREYFAYYIQRRHKQYSLMHISRRLFQQFLVDAYTMIESYRLSFIRAEQKKLRLDSFKNLASNVVSGNTDASKTGQRIILPSSFTGGSRYMMQNYLDAMAIVRHFGYPDLFITFTCNPKWPEIIRLFHNKNINPEDTPEILCRLFKIKLDSMIHDFKEKRIFGNVEAVVYTVEFQKRGLPHAHICLFLEAAYKFPSSEHVDRVICAEIPDKSQDDELFQLVNDFMIHGPCGTDNLNSPCMKQEKCSKNYPRPFKEHTSVDEDGYPLYRRRQNGRILFKGETEVDNRFVVPYNAFLLKRYQSHINVEWCNQSGAIKYLFKYINKGPDRVTAGVITSNSDVNGEVLERNVDEIKEYFDCRYISACEASWRIFGHELHHRTPAVERLSFHLPGEQPVVYDDDDDLNRVIGKPTIAASMFTSWMECNKFDANARKLTYIQFPSQYVWNPSDRIWTPRKKRPKLGRIHHVPPSVGEAYYLRCLLNKVRGPTCFEDIRTVRGNVYPTFKDACFELGILDDDKEYIDAIKDASEWASGQYLRSLFVMMLLSSSISRPEQVWSECRRFLSDGILHKYRNNLGDPGLTMEPSDLDNHTLYDIELLLRKSGSTLKNFAGMPYPPEEFVISTTNRLIYDELNYDHKELQKEHDKLFCSLNAEQKVVYEKIVSSVEKASGGVYFVYGYGGTGKTFLWKTLSTAIRAKGKIVLNVASSGIASLLLSGGRTAHSRFIIPINVTEDSFCAINQTSPLAELLKQTSLIIWDEAPMIHKHCFEALDRTMKDILRSTVPDSEQKPFGGKVVVFGGDFRQILPVVPKGSRQDIVNATLNSSYLWDHIEVLRLTANMRLQCGSDPLQVNEIKEFAEWILQVGDGAVGGLNDGEAEIQIPDDLLIKESDDPLKSIIQSTYPEVIENLYEPAYFQERAILAPTHEQVDKINERLLSMVPGESTVYLSSDSVCATDISEEDQHGLGSPEFLNSLKFSGVPNHSIPLKVGVPIMLLRNIDQPNGLCNGTRLTVLRLDKSLIKARVITGTNIGFETLIHRMKLTPSDKTLPFKITRKQFPVSVCFAMTINKSQGQSLSQVGLFLTRPVFTHGQLYVALSRVKRKKGLKVLICDNDMKVGNTTKNVVYKEVLQKL